MIKHFLKKNGRKIITLSLMLLMWGVGFYCAWEIQDRKIGQYRVLIIRIGILLKTWEGKIEKLEKEKEDRKKEEKKRKEYNESIFGAE